MIIWEVYDYDVPVNRRFYTSLSSAIRFLFTVCKRAGAIPHNSWSEPVLRAWRCDYDGSQQLMFVSNGELVSHHEGLPNINVTVGSIQRMLESHMLSEGINIEEKPASGPGCCE